MKPVLLALIMLTLPCVASGTTLSVLSYNVNFGVAGDPATVAAISDADADVVFLQETNPAWEQALKRELAQRYPHQDFHHCCRAGGLAVLSKYRIVASRVIDAPTGWFPAWLGAVDTPLGIIQALNLHLRPPISASGSWLLGYFTTGKYRIRELREYVKHLKPTLPTLAVGDFNEPKGAAIDLLQSRGFRDAVNEDQPGIATWRWTVAGIELRQVLDHVFFSQELETASTQIINAGRSDHLPIHVVFKRKPSTAARTAPRVSL